MYDNNDKIKNMLYERSIVNCNMILGINITLHIFTTFISLLPDNILAC